MKNTLFAKPNLKLFAVGAFLILMINHVFTGTTIEASARAIPLVGISGPVTDGELQRLLDFAEKHPGSETYMRVSYCFEVRGDLKKAMDYFIKAERYAEFED